MFVSGSFCEMIFFINFENMLFNEMPVLVLGYILTKLDDGHPDQMSTFHDSFFFLVKKTTD